MILIAFAAAFPTLRIWNVHLDDAMLDLGVTLVFGWLALNRDRWWPLAMAAIMALTVMVHVAIFAVPALGEYAEMSARIGLGILMALALLAGAGERWLAGDRAISDRQTWRRRRPFSPDTSTDNNPQGAALSHPSS